MNQKDLFWISLTVFLTISLWMFLDIYKIRTEEKVEKQITITVTDLKIDPAIFSQLRSKKP